MYTHHSSIQFLSFFQKLFLPKNVVDFRSAKGIVGKNSLMYAHTSKIHMIHSENVAN